MFPSHAVLTTMPSRNRQKRSMPQVRDEKLSEVNKAIARARYEEKKGRLKLTGRFEKRGHLK